MAPRSYEPLRVRPGDLKGGFGLQVGGFRVDFWCRVGLAGFVV